MRPKEKKRKKRGFSTLKITKFASIPASTVRDMRRRGFLAPELGGKWSLRQTIALGVLFHARRQGSTMSAALAAYDLLRTISDVQLNTSFEDGREYLVLDGDNVSPRLVSHLNAFDINRIESASADHRPYSVVNVKLAFERVLRIVRETETATVQTP